VCVCVRAHTPQYSVSYSVCEPMFWKLQFTYKLHGAIIQKLAAFITTALRRSNPNILNFLLLNVHNVSDVRQIEIHIAESLVPGPSYL
jgi:hypothetical protein